jgi:hypothetical protein
MKVSLATGASTTPTSLGDHDEYGFGFFAVANSRAFYADWYLCQVEQPSVDDGSRSTLAALPPSEAARFVAMTSDGQRLFWTDGSSVDLSQRGESGALPFHCATRR